MRIKRIDQALERCEEHLSAACAHGTKIESLLARSVLILMYAEFEQKIKTLVQERCFSITDDSIREFVESCARTVRGVKTSDIKKLLGRFGAIHKEAFKQTFMKRASITPENEKASAVS